MSRPVSRYISCQSVPSLATLALSGTDAFRIEVSCIEGLALRRLALRCLASRCLALSCPAPLGNEIAWRHRSGLHAIRASSC